MCNKIRSFEQLGIFICKDKLSYIQSLEFKLQKYYREPVLETSIDEIIKAHRDKRDKCLIDEINFYKQQYTLVCNKNMALENCVGLKQYITTSQDANVSINASISADTLNALRQQYKNEYLKSNCDKVFSDNALKQVSEVASKYQNIDNERIQAESIKTRNMRIFFGGLVLVSTIVIINMLSKKK